MTVEGGARSGGGGRRGAAGATGGGVGKVGVDVVGVAGVGVAGVARLLQGVDARQRLLELALRLRQFAARLAILPTRRSRNVQGNSVKLGKTR